jgi:uncharacterized protein YrrD
MEDRMFRTKDFVLMDVEDVRGKRIGFIKDILINFNNGEITGFLISPYNLFIRNSCVSSNDIVSFSKTMIIKKTSGKITLRLKECLGMEVVDVKGNVMGILEDVIFDHEYGVKGLIISSGFISKLFKGKKIVLIQEVIVGEDNIIYLGQNEKVNLISVPHKLMGGG